MRIAGRRGARPRGVAARRRHVGVPFACCGLLTLCGALDERQAAITREDVCAASAVACAEGPGGTGRGVDHQQRAQRSH
eukprot:3978519-Prymnesium_polylepis.2